MVSLVNRISSLSDEELLMMVNEKADEYTKDAIKIANEEIVKRGLSGKNNKEIIHEREESEEEVNYIPNNWTASAVKFVGFLEMFLGIIIGVIFLVQSNIITGIIIIYSGVIVGILFIGFGEIIYLLHQINERQNLKTWE